MTSFDSVACKLMWAPNVLDLRGSEERCRRVSFHLPSSSPVDDQLILLIGCHSFDSLGNVFVRGEETEGRFTKGFPRIQINAKSKLLVDLHQDPKPEICRDCRHEPQPPKWKRKETDV